MLLLKREQNFQGYKYSWREYHAETSEVLKRNRIYCFRKLCSLLQARRQGEEKMQTPLFRTHHFLQYYEMFHANTFILRKQKNTESSPRRRFMSNQSSVR